jgi:micrococcal nuclease
MLKHGGLILALACCACGGEADPDEVGRCGEATGYVERVLDGDTVELRDGRKIRYLLVNTPEIAHHAGEVPECFGNEARALNESLVNGATVRLEYDEECQDRYERTLAYVWLGDVMVNEILLTRGYARLLVIPPNERYESEFEALEQAAQDASAGLWGACE